MSVPPNNSPRVGCELVRTSSAAYLAKYYSKGKSLDGGGEVRGTTASLSTWYSVSRFLRRCIREVCTGLPASVADAIYRAAYEAGSLADFEYIKPVIVEIDGVKRFMGAIFQLNKGKTRQLQDLVWWCVRDRI